MYKPTLLYAEDDQEIRENFAIILHEYFDTVYLAKNGKEALALYREKHPDILLLDIGMPLLNGLDLVESIRNNDQNTPVIMLSAYSDTEKLLSAIGLKVEAYLLKPIDMMLFKKTITKLIRQLQTNDTVILREDLSWNTKHLTLSYKDEQIKLTKKERHLLQLLNNRIEEYLSNDDLIINIWHEEIPDHSHNNKLIQLVYRLNKKIMQYLPSCPHLIENSYTLGYRITRR